MTPCQRARQQSSISKYFARRPTTNKPIFVSSVPFWAFRLFFSPLLFPLLGIANQKIKPARPPSFVYLWRQLYAWSFHPVFVFFLTFSLVILFCVALHHMWEQSISSGAETTAKGNNQEIATTNLSTCWKKPVSFKIQSYCHLCCTILYERPSRSFSNFSHCYRESCFPFSYLLTIFFIMWRKTLIVRRLLGYWISSLVTESNLLNSAIQNWLYEGDVKLRTEETSSVSLACA